MRQALLAIVVLVTSNPSAWGQGFDRLTLLRVLLATDARQVAACQRLGVISDTSPEDLRKKIVRGGGDAGLVTFDAMDPDKMNADVYRCQPVAAAAPPPPAPVLVGDATSIHGLLLGTWTGTLLLGTATGKSGRPPGRYSATVRVSQDGGQLRFTIGDLWQ